MFDLAQYFRNRRFVGATYRPARIALEQARQDIADGRKVYTTPAANGRLSPAVNEAFSAFGEDRVAWFERPDSVGLRLVGKAHEINRRNYAYAYGLDHTGWFLDDDQHETVHGVVYQLPGQNGQPLYLYGLADPYNDGPALLSLEIVTGEKNSDGADASYSSAAREAASWADSMAEKYAEDSREHNRAYQAGQEFGELGEDVKGNRRKLLAILAERKAVANVEEPTLCDVIRGRVESLLDEIRTAREKRRELLDDWEAVEPDESANVYQRERWNLFSTFENGALSV